MKLNPTQKRVFCAINAYPQYNDRQLAEALGMKRSTVTLTRHFLQRHKLYNLEIFPNYKHLDLAMIGLKYGDYGKIRPIDYQQRMKLMTKEMKISECVWSLSCSFRGFSLFYAQDFHPIIEQLQAWDALFKSVDYSVLIEDQFFSPSAIKAFKFLETHDYVAHLLEIPPLQKRNALSPASSLRRNEKKVLQQLVDSHQKSNAEISLASGLSRSIVGQIKKRLIDRGVAKFIHLPSWPLLGVNLAVFFHLQAYPENMGLTNTLQGRSEVIFLLASSHHILFLALFRDYEDYQDSFLLKLLKEEKQLIKEPREIFFPLKETKFHLDPAPALKKMFTII